MSLVISLSSTSPAAGKALYQAASKVFELPPYEAVLHHDEDAIKKFLLTWPLTSDSTLDLLYKGPRVYFSATEKGGLVITENSHRLILVESDGRVEVIFPVAGSLPASDEAKRIVRALVTASLAGEGVDLYEVLLQTEASRDPLGKLISHHPEFRHLVSGKKRPGSAKD